LNADRAPQLKAVVRRFYLSGDEMKSFMIRVMIALSLVAIPASTPATSNAKVNSVRFCDLIRHPKRYDRKLVRVRALYQSFTDTATLSNPSCDWGRDDTVIQTKCSPKYCEQIIDDFTRMIPSQRFNLNVNVDVTGQFYAYGNGNQHLFIIMRVNDAKQRESSTR
jgi:hypothetical protein